MSVMLAVILMSSGEEAFTSKRRLPTNFAAFPGQASAVPTLKKSESWTGGLQESMLRGPPCWRFGPVPFHELSQGRYATASDTFSGVAPFGRGCVADASPATSADRATQS